MKIIRSMKISKPGMLIITDNEVHINGFDWDGEIWDEQEMRALLLEWLTPKILKFPIHEYDMIETAPGVYSIGTLLH